MLSVYWHLAQVFQSVCCGVTVQWYGVVLAACVAGLFLFRLLRSISCFLFFLALQMYISCQGSCKHRRVFRIRACVTRSYLCIPCIHVGTTVLWKRLKVEGCTPPYESVWRRWFRMKTISYGNLDITVHSRKLHCRMGRGTQKSGPVETRLTGGSGPTFF